MAFLVSLQVMGEIPRESLFASVGSLNQFVTVNLKTGVVTAALDKLNVPHGLVFVPEENGDGENER